MTPTNTNTKPILSALNKDKITTQRTNAIIRARAANLTVPEIANHAGISETHTYRILQATPTHTPNQVPTPALIKELTATLQALDPFRITLLRRQAIHDARNPHNSAGHNDASAAAPLPWQEIADLLDMTRANCHVLYSQHLKAGDEAFPNPEPDPNPEQAK